MSRFHRRSWREIVMYRCVELCKRRFSLARWAIQTPTPCEDQTEPQITLLFRHAMYISQSTDLPDPTGAKQPQLVPLLSCELEIVDIADLDP